ncbi:AMP-binding enzyme [Bacillus pacificus]
MVIQRHENVKEAVVMVREDRPNDKRIIAYIVAKEKEMINLAEIRSYVSESLANYMVPSAFVLLEELPLTPNGKVDRKKLPAPDFNGMNNERLLEIRKKKYYVIYLQKYLVFLALALMIISLKWVDIRFLHRV